MCLLCKYKKNISLKKRRECNCAIVVPIYKSCPNANEIASLRQVCYILNMYDIHLVYPLSLDVTIYLDVASKFEKRLIKQPFHDTFFHSIDGYNKLLMSN